MCSLVSPVCWSVTLLPMITLKERQKKIICCPHRNSWGRLFQLFETDVILSSTWQLSADKLDKIRKLLVSIHMRVATGCTHAQHHITVFKTHKAKINPVLLKCYIVKWTAFERLCCFMSVLEFSLSPLKKCANIRSGKKYVGKSVTFHTDDTQSRWNTEQQQTESSHSISWCYLCFVGDVLKTGFFFSHRLMSNTHAQTDR